jgi:ABC-type transport system involved in multi-copper enzyme maturation permease subunit
MMVGLAGALLYVSRHFERGDVSILLAVYFILLQLALVTALALFFSCFSTPVLSTLYTIGIYVAGVFASDIHAIGQFTRNPAMEVATRVIYYLLPNFHNFNIIAAASHGETVPFSLIWQNTVYAALYVAVVLIAAAAAFSRRNLK